MKHIESLKFYFVEWPLSRLFGLVVMIIFLIAFIGFLVFNVPVSGSKKIQGVVIGNSVDSATIYELPVPTVRVRLATGNIVDISVPVILSPGDKVIVVKSNLLITNNVSYEYGGVLN